jgi:hypothetical protein
MVSLNASALPVLFLLSILVLPVLAHAPASPGESSYLSTAVLIGQPEKSYVIYGHLHEPGDAAYYRFDMTEGQTLHVALLANSRSTAAADLIIMGPQLPSSGTPPESLETRAGDGVVVVPGSLPDHAEYEPFSPAAIYPVASYTVRVPATGTYYAAVFSSDGEQDYSFAPGFREEFTVSEWLLVPVSVTGGHVWEGQSLAVILAPCIAVVLLGIVLMLYHQKKTGAHGSMFSWLAILAGLLYLGGAAVTFTQMVRALWITGWDPSAALTIIFIGIPAGLGLAALWTGLHSGQPVILKERLILAVTGVLGLVFWGGLIIGPVIAFAAAIVPEGKAKGP